MAQNQNPTEWDPKLLDRVVQPGDEKTQEELLDRVVQPGDEKTQEELLDRVVQPEGVWDMPDGAREYYDAIALERLARLQNGTSAVSIEDVKARMERLISVPGVHLAQYQAGIAEGNTQNGTAALVTHEDISARYARFRESLKALEEFRAGVLEGDAQADRGETHPHEEVMAEMHKIIDDAMERKEKEMETQKTYTLLLWQEAPDGLDRYLIPNEVADLYRSVFEGAHEHCVGHRSENEEVASLSRMLYPCAGGAPSVLTPYLQSSEVIRDVLITHVYCAATL